jgi:hypothetical protein
MKEKDDVEANRKNKKFNISLGSQFKCFSNLNDF